VRRCARTERGDPSRRGATVTLQHVRKIGRFMAACH
jgi:hypothetical protein